MLSDQSHEDMGSAGSNEDEGTSWAARQA